MEKKLRVCMVGSSFKVRGGMTSVCRQLSDHAFGHGIEIEYVATHEFGSGFQRCRMFLKGYTRVLGLLMRKQVDIVHLHMSERGSFYRKYLLFRLAKRFHKRVVLHMHGADFRTFYEKSGTGTQRMVRAMLRGCDRVVVLGENWDRIIRNMEPRTRTLVINNAVSIPELTARWDEAESHLCYMGVLIPRKGVADLLDALRILLDRDTLPRPVRLTIAGSGQEEAALMARCRELGLSDRVSFVGWTTGDEKQTLLLSSQCFILPSYNEGLPVAILEAISVGLPVVSTNVGSINEAVLDGVDGRFAPVHNPGKLADAIADTISDGERWTQLSAGARKIARSRFDENLLFDHMEALYLSLAEELHD